MQGRIIYNPTAGPWDVTGELQQVQHELRRRGWHVDLVETRCSGDATRMAHGAAEAGIDVVWVAGGDGTVSEVVNGLVHSDTAMGVLPVGTGNMWAKQLHLPTYTLTHPFGLREAAIAQIEGRVRPIDVGQVNERYFLLWASAGFDAAVTTEIEPRARPIKRLGALPYVVAAVTMAQSYSGTRMRIRMERRRAVRGRVILALVSNVQFFALVPAAVRRARIDDGLLDLLVFKGLGFSYIIKHTARLFSGRHLRDPKTVYRQAGEITIESEIPCPVQVDGDPIGHTPVTIRSVPRALKILVPAQAPDRLFSR